MSSTESVKKLRNSRKEKGLCINCGKNLPLSGKSRCQICTELLCTTDRHRRGKQKLLGACSIKGCQQPIKCNALCKYHREEKIKYTHNRNEQLKSNGLCTACAKNPIIGSYLCEVCHLKRAAKKYLGDGKKWQMLQQKLEQQNRQCTYSGLPITIGKNASIDHILAKSKGGKNHIDNLQWVHIWINKMKNDLPHEEFIKLLDDFAPKLAAHRYAASNSSMSSSLVGRENDNM